MSEAEKPQPEMTGADSAAPQTIKKKKQGFSALEIAEQVNQVREWLSQGKRINNIRALCAEHWGLATRTAEYRIKDARKQMVQDIESVDRKELASQLIETLLKVQEQALDTRQGSNAIGASRLISELTGLLGRSS